MLYGNARILNQLTEVSLHISTVSKTTTFGSKEDSLFLECATEPQCAPAW